MHPHHTLIATNGAYSLVRIHDLLVIERDGQVLSTAEERSVFWEDILILFGAEMASRWGF